MEKNQSTSNIENLQQPDSNPATNIYPDAVNGFNEDGLPKIGDIVDDCTIVEVIHVSDMAVVYKGLSDFSGCYCAVKICRPYSSKAYRRAFVLKRNLHARLNFAEMPSLNTGGTWKKELPFSNVVFYEGLSLQNIIEASGPLPPAIALTIGIIILEALKNSCEKIETSGWGGYLYRCVWSILPEDILVTTSGQLKILDIGLEQFFDDRLPLKMSWEDLPPPQYSTTLDLSTIIYSFGAFLVSLLSELSQSMELISDLTAIANKKSEIYPVIEKCLSGKIGTGYIGFDEIIEDLKSCLALFSTAPEDDIVATWFLNGEIMKKKPKAKRPK